ncbi:hypothetical protein MFMK1_003455 [Metallumcola ferriviriculae]|uniref:Tetratricopeptide repeat protein n=1 Tax=Metallumcola ferriviriculae TaxID=3039180 RepID=A0AAU0UR55_9FIRM|nr:hypothetical protein MFMK1_003455 [Desulfitibacteraceae bacterium MK1]
MSWHELYNHGCSSYRHNNYIEAEQCFVESIQLNPAHSLSWYNLGTLKLKMKQPQEASKCLLVAKQYNPQHINTRMNLASAYCLIGKSKLAIKELQLILGIYPNCHQAKELLIKLESVKNPEKRHQD